MWQARFATPRAGELHLRPFLLGSTVCDCDHPAVAALSLELVGRCTSVAEAAASVRAWVREHIVYTLQDKSDLASQTLAKREGMCTNKANLQVALLRAAGIPAGYSLVHVTKDAFAGPHTLPEVLELISPITLHVFCSVYIPAEEPEHLAVEAAAPDGLVALLLAADMPIHRGSGERDAESEHSWAASGADPRCAASRRLVLRPAGEGGCGFDAHAALLTSGDFCARLEVPGHSRHTCETPPDTLPSTAPRQSVIESTTKYPPSDSNHATRLPPLASRRSGATRRWRIGARRWRGRPPPRHSAAACWSAPPCWPRPSAFAQRAAPLGGAPSPRNRATCER